MVAVEQSTKGRSGVSPAGFVMDTSSPLKFHPGDLHAACPWGGCRLLLIAYHVRNAAKLCAEDLAKLKEANFEANTTLA